MGEDLLRHARAVIAAYLAQRPWRPSGDEPDNRPAQGCFVSLKADGRLRGCIGSLVPRHSTLLEEVAENALGAAFRDPRFPPLRAEELPGITLSLDLLSPLEPVEGLAELDPARYGVVVRHASLMPGACGVLLPALAGVDTPALQVALCCEKAGIDPGTPANELTLERFTVTRLVEGGGH